MGLDLIVESCAKPGHEADLKKRTLTNLYNARPAWLDMAHKALDQAVAAAYDWPDYTPAMPDEENMPSKQPTKLFFMAVPNQVMDALSLAQRMGGMRFFFLVCCASKPSDVQCSTFCFFSAQRHRRYTTAVVAGGEGA